MSSIRSCGVAKDGEDDDVDVGKQGFGPLLLINCQSLSSSYHMSLLFQRYQSNPSCFSLIATLNLSSRRDTSEIKSVTALVKASCGL